MNVDFVNLENSQFYFHSEQYICSVFELPTDLSTQDSYFQCNFFFFFWVFTLFTKLILKLKKQTQRLREEKIVFFFSVKVSSFVNPNPDFVGSS